MPERNPIESAGCYEAIALRPTQATHSVITAANQTKAYQVIEQRHHC